MQHLYEPQKNKSYFSELPQSEFEKAMTKDSVHKEVTV